jgi:hypothetical protein
MKSPAGGCSAAPAGSVQAMPGPIAAAVDNALSGYADEPQPFSGYMTLVACYNAGLVTALVAAQRRGRLPDQLDTKDILILGVATHKLARLLTKDSVTSFMRAPFVRLEEKSGTNSITEKPRGSGLRRSIGELVSCPECTGQWVATGLIAGLLHAPRVTRVIGALYASLAVGDILQFVYVGLKSRA